jgi:protein subunit release factor A
MLDKLTAEEQRYEELTRLLSSNEVQSDPTEYRKHAKALAEVEPLVERFREYKVIARDVAQTEELAAGADADMRELAREELKSLLVRRDAIVAELKSCSCRKTRTTPRTSSSKSAPAPAATKRRCSPASCIACTRNSPSVRAGASR